MLTVTVDLRKATSNDLARLSWEFKAVVKKALQSLPTPRTDPHAAETALAYHLDGVAPTDPTRFSPTLTVTLDCSKVNQRSLQALENKFKAILREVSVHLPQGPLENKLLQWDAFVRDLRRYDWHRLYGFSFRYIAFLERQLKEQACREGRELEEPLEPPSVEPRQVGEPVLGEDGVEKGVKRIDKTLHRLPYPDPQPQWDVPTHDPLQYACPYHLQHDCSETCPYLTRWEKNIRRLLPGDYHGGSQEVPVSNSLLDTLPGPGRPRHADNLLSPEEPPCHAQADELDTLVYVRDEQESWRMGAFTSYDEIEWLSLEDPDPDYLTAYEQEDDSGAEDIDFLC